MPSSIIKELQELAAMSRMGVEKLFEAESKLAECEHEVDTTEARAFLAAEGTVADRQALAKLAAADARLNRDIARAEVNRIRVKLKTIEGAMIANSTMAKILETESRL